MACCAVAAMFIYRLIQLHETVTGLRSHHIVFLSSTKATQAIDSSIADEAQSCRLSLIGLTCTDCSTSIRKALLANPGICSVHVSFVLCETYIIFHPHLVDVKSIISIVEEGGYSATLEADNPSWNSRFIKAHEHRKQEAFSWRAAFIASALLTGSILVLPDLPIPYAHSAPAHVVPFLQGACSATALFICARRIHLEAFRSVLRMRPNMSLLSSLGLLLGFMQALVARWENDVGQDVFSLYSFDALTALCTVVLGGRFLKAITSRSSFASTAQLAGSLPRTATVTFVRDEKHNPFNDSASIPVDMLRAEEWVVVPPQTVIPGDGLVVQGRSSVLEALRTGELLPKQKCVGDQVFAGTANQESFLIIQLTRNANDTWLEKTLECVAQTEGSKNGHNNATDTAGEYFVTGVICLTLAISLFWRAQAHARWSLCLERAATMLLCACPCALGLAKPTCITLASCRSFHASAACLA
jgi:Cu+-exporting ATPase